MTVVDDILSLTQQQLGKTYVFGAAGPNTFDCSGLVKYVFGKYGISLPHHAADQAMKGTPVDPGQIQPGDLVFSDWGDGPNSHVGIAVSGSQIIDAPHTGAVVRYDTLTSSYRQHITAVRRLLADDGSGVGAGGITVPTKLPLPTDPIVEPLKDIAASIKDVRGIADKAFSVFLPTNFMRVVAGLSGVVFILIGIWFLSRELRAKDE